MTQQTIDRVAGAATAPACPPAGEFWHALLACPNCTKPLPDRSACPSCHARFGADGGTPILISPAAARAVTWKFPQARSFLGDEAVARVVTYPIFEPGKDGPYHLDRAHVHVIRQLPAGSRVLEIGCGGGQARPWFKGLGHSYVGTDISKTRVHDWLKKFGGPDLLSDCHFLPFRDQSFDLVYCAAVFEHLACPHLAAQEAMRVLKPGGHFLGNCSFLEPWHDRSYYHMSPLGVIELLTQAGFQIDHIWPGRGYTAYRAIPSMSLRKQLRPLRYFAKPIELAYRLQGYLANRSRGKSAVLHHATIAGATDWIARRPA